MKNRGFGIQFILVFLIVTACITILSGILGMVFLPDVRIGYEAFLTPPIFGLLSALLGLVTKSRKELSVGQMLFRNFLQLLLIEAMVFGANYIVGTTFDWKLGCALAIGIAVIFVISYGVLWLNDKRSASAFNAKLIEFQNNQENAQRLWKE